jgi:transketolase
LAIAGYIDTKEIKTLRSLVRVFKDIQLDIRNDKKIRLPGIEYSGGSEGIGLSVSIGIALAKKRDGGKIEYTL